MESMLEVPWRCCSSHLTTMIKREQIYVKENLEGKGGIRFSLLWIRGEMKGKIIERK